MMGMTIDEAIKKLEWALANNTIEDVESAYKYILAIHMAIDTMRKYQKIVQIMERTVDDGTSMYDTLQEIEEVVEDGNDDSIMDNSDM
jgi:hypothetical protein